MVCHVYVRTPLFWCRAMYDRIGSLLCAMTKREWIHAVCMKMYFFVYSDSKSNNEINF